MAASAKAEQSAFRAPDQASRPRPLEETISHSVSGRWNFPLSKEPSRAMIPIGSAPPWAIATGVTWDCEVRKGQGQCGSFISRPAARDDLDFDQPPVGDQAGHADRGPCGKRPADIAMLHRFEGFDLRGQIGVKAGYLDHAVEARTRTFEHVADPLERPTIKIPLRAAVLVDEDLPPRPRRSLRPA